MAQPAIKARQVVGEGYVPSEKTNSLEALDVRSCDILSALNDPAGYAIAGVRFVFSIRIRLFVHDDGGAVRVEYGMAQAGVQSDARGKESRRCAEPSEAA